MLPWQVARGIVVCCIGRALSTRRKQRPTVQIEQRSSIELLAQGQPAECGFFALQWSRCTSGGMPCVPLFWVSVVDRCLQPSGSKFDAGGSPGALCGGEKGLLE